jgi:Protein of unknown function (DUF2478)
MRTDISRTRLAAVTYERGFDIDGLLSRICLKVRSRGLSVGGLLQSSFGGTGGCAESVIVTDLRSNNVFDIWDRRGQSARGCRLDENGLIEAQPILLVAIADRVDLLIINRFGRAESLGRGMLSIFSRAIDADVPVLTAVRRPYDAAWHSFHGGMGSELAPDIDAIEAWACAVGEKAA